MKTRLSSVVLVGAVGYSAAGGLRSTSENEVSVAAVEGRDLRSSTWIWVPQSGVVKLGCFSKNISGGVTRNLQPYSRYTETYESECKSLCFQQQFFTITPDVENDRWLCTCHSKLPGERLSFSDCSTPEQGTDLYFRIIGQTASGCTDLSKGIQGRVINTGENNAPQGWDLVTNEFAELSPFELIADGCGTNMYDINTAAMSSSQTLKTDFKSASEYQSSTKSSVDESVKLEGSAGYKGFIEVSAKVSSSSSSSINNLFTSSQSQSSGTKVAESWAVVRTTTVSIKDFDNRKYFATFSQGFFNALKDYKNSNFDGKKGRTILKNYGTFLAERVMYGGHYSSRSALSTTTQSQGGSSDQEVKECFELGAAGEASGFGFKASVDYNSSKCTTSQITAMSKASSDYSRETNTDTLYGGYKDENGLFQVNSETAILITDTKMYPSNDRERAKFRPLTDLLDPSKVSPIMFQPGMVESDYALIKTKLESLVIETNNAIAEILDSCPKCSNGIPYLKEYDLINAKFTCSCYGDNDDQCARGTGKPGLGNVGKGMCCTPGCKYCYASAEDVASIGPDAPAMYQCRAQSYDPYGRYNYDNCCLDSVLNRPCSKYDAPCKAE